MTVAAAIMAYNAERKLTDTLESLSGQVDQIVIGIDSKTTDHTQEVAEAFGAETFTFDLDDDFSQARQQTFDRVTTDWALWIDTDDTLASDIPVRQLAAEQPAEVGAVWLPYVYHRDEYGNVTTLFDRERLIRMSAKPRWQGRLHETCTYEGTLARDGRVWVEHKNRTEEGKGERNFRILHKMVEDPNDHRAVIYLAHQYFAGQDWENACLWYEKFLDLRSPGDVAEEKWQAMVYLAKARRSYGDISGSIRAANQALLLCPQYADAYFELSQSYATRGDWERSIHWHEEGLTKKQPDRVLIQNPLDYTFNPFVISHFAYYQAGNLDKAIESVEKACAIRPKDPILVNAYVQYNWRKERDESIRSAVRIADHLLECNEPLKAQAVLDNLPAGTISPLADEARGRVAERLAHLKDDVEYENFYFMSEESGDPLEKLDIPFPRADWIIERLQKIGAKRVLDVGIGDGQIPFRLARAGIQTVGIDIDPRRVKEANRYAVKAGYMNERVPEDRAQKFADLIATNQERLNVCALEKARLPEADSDNSAGEVRQLLDEKIAMLEARDKALKEERDAPAALPTMDRDAMCQFHYGSADDIPQKVRDLGPYDAVILGEILEHVPDPEKVLDQADALAPRVLITTPDGASSYQYFENKMNPNSDHGGHIRAYARNELEALLWKRGRLVESHTHPETEYILLAEYAPKESILERPPVVIYCGPGLEEWTPDQIDRKGLGGSETAAVKLAEALVDRGLRVMVYGPSEGVWNGVFYRHFSKFNPRNPVFAFISWRNPAMFDLPVQAQVKYLWMHDTDAGPNLTEERAKGIDGVMALSGWHINHLETMYPFLTGKCFVIGNGIDPTRFDNTDVIRDPNRVAYASSPDRGLEQALLLWPQVREQNPNAELHVFYGFENFDKMGGPADYKRKIMNLAKQPGVVMRGRMGQKELAQELQKCSAMFYPGPHDFCETFGIAFLEAQAAGCVPVTRDNGALPETNRFGIVLANDSDKYVESLLLAMGRTGRKRMIAWAKDQTWAQVAGRLIDQFRGAMAKAA